MAPKLALLWLVFCAQLAFASAAHAQRVALLIGNSSYHSAPLTNPPNDVRVMETALKRVGPAAALQRCLGSLKPLWVLRWQLLFLANFQSLFGYACWVLVNYKPCGLHSSQLGRTDRTNARQYTTDRY